jgi:phosphomethylpyrimidine synthase
MQSNRALQQLMAACLPALAAQEGLNPQFIENAITQGSMVLLGNPSHPRLRPLLVGQPSRVKVNANIGTSAWCASQEMEKLKVSLEAGADTVMDLSIAGDLNSIRRQILEQCPQPLGTVPMYAVAQRYIEAARDPAEFAAEELFAEIAAQAQQGVDFMTVHCGVSMEAAAAASEERALGIVSRGGSILARWMRKNKKQNPLLTEYARILEIARAHNVTLSLGDGLRPGAGMDAGDGAQWREVILLGQLARQGLQAGVQCMIEGPGHVPLAQVPAQVQAIKRLTNNAPLYVLGPLVTDIAAGHDHLAGAIGGALAVQAGADFLCYLTPAEHLCLPDSADVHAGVMASRIAAQAGEAALGRSAALERERAMAAARKSLDWEKMAQTALDAQAVQKRRLSSHQQKDECAMCGEFCAIKMARD